MTPLKLLSECPRADCSIEHLDYYRCASCGRDFVVRSGEDGIPDDLPDVRELLIQAAYGWVGSG